MTKPTLIILCLISCFICCTLATDVVSPDANFYNLYLFQALIGPNTVMYDYGSSDVRVVQRVDDSTPKARFYIVQDPNAFPEKYAIINCNSFRALTYDIANKNLIFQTLSETHGAVDNNGFNQLWHVSPMSGGPAYVLCTFLPGDSTRYCVGYDPTKTGDGVQWKLLDSTTPNYWYGFNFKMAAQKMSRYSTLLNKIPISVKIIGYANNQDLGVLRIINSATSPGKFKFTMPAYRDFDPTYFGTYINGETGYSLTQSDGYTDWTLSQYTPDGVPFVDFTTWRITWLKGCYLTPSLKCVYGPWDDSYRWRILF